MALVRAGGPGDADVPVDVVPLDAGFSEPEFLAEGIHPGHALLEVAAGPDVSEEGHAVRLRFIRTSRNTKMSPVRGAEQSGVSAAEPAAGGWSEARSTSGDEGSAGPERPSYAGEAVEGLEALVGRLSVRPSWRAVLAQEPPPRPVFLRNGHGRSHLFLPSSPHVLGERWTAALEPLDSRAEEEKEQGTINDR